MIPADLITIELARLVETSDEWLTRFRRYDQLQDAGLSCEEAARIVTAAYRAASSETMDRRQAA